MVCGMSAVVCLLFAAGLSSNLILPLHHKSAKYHFHSIQEALSWYNSQTLAFSVMKDACLHVPLEELIVFMKEHPRYRDRLKWLVLAGPPSLGPSEPISDPPVDDVPVSDICKKIDYQWRENMYSKSAPDSGERIMVIDVRCDFTFYQPATTLYGAVMWYVPPLDIFRPSICHSRAPLSLLSLCMNPEHEMAFNSRHTRPYHAVVFYRQSNCPRLAEVMEATKYFINALRRENKIARVTLLRESDLFTITYSSSHLISSIHFGCNTKECDVPRGPSEVIPRLWVGSIRDTLDDSFLKNNHITKVIKLCRGGGQPSDPNVVVARYHLLDQNWFVLKQHVATITEMVQEGLDTGGSVFVCCSFGRSRSVSVIVSYLMRYKSMTMAQAFQAVWSKRWFAYPNMGFYEQLRETDAEMHPRQPQDEPLYDTYSYHALMYDIQAELQKTPNSRYRLPSVPSSRLCEKLGFQC